MVEDWATAWRDRVAASVRRATDGFEQRFGFPAGPHALGPPTSSDVLVATTRLDPPLAADLLAFYRAVGPVSLPDVGNGHFLHPLDTLNHYTDGGDLPRVGAPVDVQLHVFGSDGGGTLYAVPAGSPGPVYRLRNSGMVAEVFDAERVVVIAEDFRGFLTKLEHVVLTFADRGVVTDL